MGLGGDSCAPHQVDAGNTPSRTFVSHRHRTDSVAGFLLRSLRSTFHADRRPADEPARRRLYRRPLQVASPSIRKRLRSPRRAEDRKCVSDALEEPYGPNDFMVQQLRRQITQQAICDAIWMDTAICSRRKIPRHTRRRLKREGRGLQAGRASATRLRFVRGSPSCKLRPGMNKAEMNVAVPPEELP